MSGMIVMLLTYLLLSAAFCEPFAASKRLSSFADFPTTIPEVGLADAILTRNTDDSVVLKKAAAIFNDRLSSSTPLQDAAMDLLRTCKTSQNIDDRQLAKDMEGKAKQIYAIRAAMIDLLSASVNAPRACSVLSQSDQRAWYQANRSSLSDPANLPSTKELEACVKGLFDINNSWTSFTTHRQDANTLCEVPGTENASRMILELLNDVSGIIPEWINTFRSEQEAHTAQLENRKEYLQQIHELQERHKTEIMHERADVEAKMIQLDQIWQSHVSRVGKHADAHMTDLSGKVDQMQNDLDGYSQNFLAARSEHERLLAMYRAAVLEGLQLQQSGIENMESAIGSLVSSYEQANGEMIEQSEAFSDRISFAMKEAAAYQSDLSLGQSELGAIQQANIERQKETLAFSIQLEESVANSVGQFMSAIKIMEAPLATLNALTTGNISTGVKHVVACATITILLLGLCQFRYALVFVCSCTLVWTLLPVSLEIAMMVRLRALEVISLPQLRHFAWLVGAILAVLVGVYRAVRAIIALSTLACHAVDAYLPRRRRCSNTIDLQTDLARLPEYHVGSLGGRHGAFKRASTVEPGMIGYY